MRRKGGNGASGTSSRTQLATFELEADGLVLLKEEAAVDLLQNHALVVVLPCRQGVKPARSFPLQPSVSCSLTF
jgi:hypothetical protein